MRTLHCVFRWHLTPVAALALASVVGVATAVAAPIKVACIGEHSTHSDHFPATDRERQPVGKQEYPAMLQGLLGPAYDVRNFGDCCATVMQGYKPSEDHPYVDGSLPGRGPGYQESIAFQPDIVIIGSWGRHDWGQGRQSVVPPFDLGRFQAAYDDLVQRYLALPSHPRVFVSLPIPIQNGAGDVPDNGVTTARCCRRSAPSPTGTGCRPSTCSRRSWATRSCSRRATAST
jgi:hypothetical protein